MNTRDHLNVPQVPSQLQDVADDRDSWRGVTIDGQVAGAMGFNPETQAGGLYLEADARWLLFWPIDREAFVAAAAEFIRCRFGVKPKLGAPRMTN